MGWLLLLLMVPVSLQAELLWVFFADKGDGRGGRQIWHETAGPDLLDLPVDEQYVEQLQRVGLSVRSRSRWLNGVSIEADRALETWLISRPFVRQVQPVAQLRRPATDMAPAQRPTQIDYGAAFEQLEQIGAIALHNQGFKGEGVRIGVLDTGFHYRDHPAFGRLQVVAERDFINGDDSVVDEDGQSVTGDETASQQNTHGTQVLSLLVGWDPGRLVGVAPEAEYLLAKTEELAGLDRRIEEDRWVEALEWADSLGADVVTSSLGYIDFDDGSGYTPEQLDGFTPLTSRVAAAAARRGIVVVTAAGNEGDTSWGLITSPADAPGVIAVGAVDLVRRQVASFSSRGPTADGRIKPDLVAPGVGVVVAALPATYQRINGTSFATPLVAGLCALLLQIHPQWDSGQVLAALVETAVDLGPEGADTAYGWGFVDGLAASGLQAEVPVAGAAFEPFPNPVSGQHVFFPVQLTAPGPVVLRIFDVSGNLVAQSDWQLAAGDYRRPERALRWQVDEGSSRASGVYFYQLRAGGIARAGKIALVRP